jgi:hypothetical protein
MVNGQEKRKAGQKTQNPPTPLMDRINMINRIKTDRPSI